MMISSKGRYAIRTMVELALKNNGSFIPLHEIASKQDISKKYLESIVKILIQKDLIEGLSGKGGGYRLKRTADKYTVSEILECAEGKLISVSCVCKESLCDKRGDCLSFPIWIGLQTLINNYLNNFTLQDILEKNLLIEKVSNTIQGEYKCKINY